MKLFLGSEKSSRCSRSVGTREMQSGLENECLARLLKRFRKMLIHDE